MKKAKIMLSAIAVVAVVSGALAFKANRSPRVIYTGTATTTTTALVCTAPLTTVLTATPNVNKVIYNTVSGSCPFVAYKTIE
jgi:hypothetical protein